MSPRRAEPPSLRWAHNIYAPDYSQNNSDFYTTYQILAYSIACMKLVRCYLTIILLYAIQSFYVSILKMLVPCFYSDLSFILEGKTFPVALTRSDMLYIKGI